MSASFLRLAILAVTLVLARSPVSHAGDSKSCSWPGIWVSRIGSVESNREMWSGGFQLAYDAMTRTGEATAWHEEELHRNTDRVGSALARLAAAHRQAWTSLEGEFTYLMVGVRFNKEFRDALVAKIPGAPRAIRLPTPNLFSTEFNEFCDEVCGCWIRFPNIGDSPIRVYFPQPVNLIYATRKLRTIADVESANLVRDEGWSVQGTRDEKRLAVRLVGEDCNFTVTSGSAKQYFVVTPTEVRHLEPAEASQMSEFSEVPLPSDVWAQ